MAFKIKQDAVLYAKGRSRAGETWVVTEMENGEYHTENNEAPVIDKTVVAIYRNAIKIL